MKKDEEDEEVKGQADGLRVRRLAGLLWVRMVVVGDGALSTMRVKSRREAGCGWLGGGGRDSPCDWMLCVMATRNQRRWSGRLAASTRQPAVAPEPPRLLSRINLCAPAQPAA